MSLYAYLYKKLAAQLHMILITDHKPKKIIKLDPMDPQDLNIDTKLISTWSSNNIQLYNLLLANGMAQFICNREFLNSFYTHLQFMYCNLEIIDQNVTLLTNLKILNLFHNRIAVLEHVPQKLQELYIDFNVIQSVKIKGETRLELLSISHNRIDDRLVGELVRRCPGLRCLNVGYNRIEEIRGFVAGLKKFTTKLKLLIAKNNPISMLALYWEYITTEIGLEFFDGQKYVKPEPVKEVVPEVKEEKKEEKKDEKKDAKKDTKKGGKAQQKPVQEQKKVEVKIQPPKVKTEQDFKQIRLKIEVNALQNVSGVVYDSSIFPQQNLNIKKTQSCFWIQTEFLGKKITTEQNKIQMDSIIPDGEINRIGFQLIINETIDANYENFIAFNKGLTVFVYKEEPQVDVDAESGEQKPALNDKKEIKMKVETVGGVFVDFQELWGKKKKELARNCNIFDSKAVCQPLFKKPYENQSELISKNKIQFDAKLAALEQQKRKKQEEQQAAKAQKKGGKDSKKAPAKKQAKKDSKQPLGQKKTVQKCTYPADPHQYRYLGEQKMFKCQKQKLGIRIVIE